MSTNQLFEPEGNAMINPQVLLSDWLGQDNNILETEYDNYMEKRTKENTNTLVETNMEIEESGWTKFKCKVGVKKKCQKKTNRKQQRISVGIKKKIKPISI